MCNPFRKGLCLHFAKLKVFFVFFLICSHIRAGAPPVINPLETQFSENAAFSLAHNFTLMLGSAGPNMTFFNLTNPAVGDWFIAAHLPKDDGKIEPKVSPLQPVLIVSNLILMHEFPAGFCFICNIHSCFFRGWRCISWHLF